MNNYLRKFFRHLRTVNRHRRAVFIHCVKVGIPWQGLTHDLSKFAPAEFLQSVKYYEGFRSPNERERETIGYSQAWMHHMGRNRHHFEYWRDYDPKTRIMKPVEMPVRYVAEMFCDRVAASKTYNGAKYTDKDPIEYFLRAKGTRVIHPKTSDTIEMLLTMLRDEGEDKTFEYIRTMVRNDRKSRRNKAK